MSQVLCFLVGLVGWLAGLGQAASPACLARSSMALV